MDDYSLWLEDIDWIKLRNELTIDETSNFYEGSFDVPIKVKEDLSFKIKIGINYPNNNIRFICTNADGYEHQMTDGLICHNPDVYLDKKTKFQHELKKLKMWIKKFYVNEEESAHYEHLLFPDQKNKLILFTDLNLEFLSSKRQGHFHFIIYNQFKNKLGEVQTTYLLLDLEDIDISFSETFKNFTKIKSDDINQGIWLHIDEPPVLYRRKTISKWAELLNILSEDQIKHLYSFRDSVYRQKGKEAKYFILLSYPIPNTEKNRKEAHLEFIEDNVKEGPNETKYKNLELYKKIERDDEITWCRSKNISYENFFGRGVLSKPLIESKLLIIGIGAIGSSLAKILVRGGATKLDIIDFDIVESGNICRSEYRPQFILSHKVSALKLELASISPFVEIEIINPIFSWDQVGEGFDKKKKELHEYDIIFDCTTDKYLSNVLDKMNLPGRVLNFSITNKANEFVSVTGTGNITSQKKKIFENLTGDEQKEPFFPEVGCFQPTFEASYNDINLLLNYAIKEINIRLKNEVGLQSFVIRTNEQANGLNVELDYDLYFLSTAPKSRVKN